MKKLLIGFLLFFLVVPLMAEDEAYRLMEFSLAVGNALDCYTTRALFKRPGFRGEANPFLARWIYKNDFRAIACTVVGTAIQIWLAERTRKKNKTLGYFLLGFCIVVKAYLVIHNLRYL